MFANKLLHFPNMIKLLFLIPLTALVVACSGGSTNSDREAAIADSIMMFGDKTIACYNPEWRTEEKFKLFFKNNFGVPSSPESKQVFNEAYQQYVKGWDDSVNF